MVIDPIASTTATPPPSQADAAAKSATLDYDNFLKLFIEELKNQDPTDPMDTTDQIAQLATFSQVEQTVETNKRLELLLQSTNLSQAGSMIGRTLTSPDGLITGTVEQVRVTGDDLIAILANGQEVLVTSGVTLS